MAIYQEQVRIAVIVIIKEPQAPTTQKLRRRSYLARLVGKREIFLIMIKTKKLLLNVCHEKVLPAVAIIICGIDTHSGTGFSRSTEAHAGGEPDLFEFAAPIINKKKVGQGVIRDEEIHSAVVVHVRRDCAKRLTGRVGYAGL